MEDQRDRDQVRVYEANCMAGETERANNTEQRKDVLIKAPGLTPVT